jgi:hypothetical protein
MPPGYGVTDAVGIVQTEQMNMQAKWRRVFAIVFGVLIWAATVALLEACGYFLVLEGGE